MHLSGCTTPSRMPARSSAATSRQLEAASSKSASSRMPWKVTFFRKMAMPAWGRGGVLTALSPQPARRVPPRPWPTACPLPGLTQWVVAEKVDFADFQEAAVLREAPHAGLQLLLRQGVQDQVHAWRGKEGPRSPPAPARRRQPESQTLPMPGPVSSLAQPVGGALEEGRSPGTWWWGGGVGGWRGPRTLPGRVLEHVPLKGGVPGVGEAGAVELREPGLEVRLLLGRPWRGGMPVSPAAVLRAAPGLGGAGQLTHGGEDAAAQAEGDGDGGLAHAA